MYVNDEVAYKYMPFNVQAALGLAQFQRLDELVGRKREMLALYRERLADVPDIQLNPEPEGVVNSAWCTALVIGRSHGLDKAQAMARMEAAGLPSRPMFYPLSSLPAYSGLTATYRPLNPTAYDISERGINLPSALNLSDAQIVEVADAVTAMLTGGQS